ncbi:caspase family protein [Candidatus Poribacteria bacterium]|nr:caspase family protein [Candidatus Poribacteria bacterium]
MNMLKNSLWKILGYLFLMCRLFLTFEKPANAEQYAILVGIWEYHNVNLQLEAPPNDLELMKSLLSAGGVTLKNMNILTNPDKEQIQCAFRTLSRGLTPDDSLLFYFSGHGTQIIDKFGTFPADEAQGRYPDKNDEALLPVDVNLASPETYLLDDELNAMLQELQTKKITCIIDTCYSADILKEIRLGRAKGAPIIDCGRRGRFSLRIVTRAQSAELGNCYRCGRLSAAFPIPEVCR